MARNKEQLTKSDLKGATGYKISDNTIYELQHGRSNKGYFYPPLLIEGQDWFVSKYNNLFFYRSAVTKLNKYILDKEKKIAFKKQIV